MKRLLQGLVLGLLMVISSGLILASAVAWGPHSCGLVFIKVIGCAIGSYENLSGGLLAADAAIFAGWLAWSAVQVQVSAEERRATADRSEIENVLAIDVDDRADGLAAVWRLLECLENPENIDDLEVRSTKLEAVVFGINQITTKQWLDPAKEMVTSLGWSRRRLYQGLFAALEQLRTFIEDAEFDASRAEGAVRDAANWFEALLPADREDYFDGLPGRSPKAWPLAYAIQVRAGLDPDLEARQ